MELLVALAIASIISVASVPMWKKVSASFARREKVIRDPFCSQAMPTSGKVIPFTTFYSILEESAANRVCDHNSRIAECYQLAQVQCRTFALESVRRCWALLGKLGQVSGSAFGTIGLDAQMKYSNLILGCVYPLVDRTFQTRLIKDKPLCRTVGVFLAGGQEAAYRAACSTELQ